MIVHFGKRACELVGLETMPVVIRNYSDDEATVVMVDTNLQREVILPSEKAHAYRMKFDAILLQRSLMSSAGILILITIMMLLRTERRM